MVRHLLLCEPISGQDGKNYKNIDLIINKNKKPPDREGGFLFFHDREMKSYSIEHSLKEVIIIK